MNFRNNFLTVIFACLSLFAISQENKELTARSLQFSSYTTEQGLPSNQSFGVYQDKIGFLWISTSEGLTRYDGYDFKTYFDDGKSGIHLKGACGFYEDSDGKFWVINSQGYLHRFNRATDKFEAIDHRLQDGWNFQVSHNIISDNDDKLWISVHGGLLHVDPGSDSLEIIEINAVRSPESWPHPEKVRIGCSFLQEDVALWLGTIKFGLVRYDLHTGATTFYRFDSRFERYFLSDLVSDIIPLDDRTLLIADRPVGLLFWDMIDEKIIKVVQVHELLGIDDHISINDIAPIGEGLFWLATEEAGIMLYDQIANNIRQQYLPNDGENTLGGIKCNFVFNDRSGDLWVGTNSLQYASSDLYKFTDYFVETLMEMPLPHNDIFWMSVFAEDKLIISTPAGACLFDPDISSFEYPLMKEVADRTYAATGIDDESVWLGSQNWLYKLNLQTKEIQDRYSVDISVDDEGNRFRRIFRVMDDSRGDTWAIDHWGRLKLINNNTGSVSNVFELAQDDAKSRFVNVISMIDDPKNDQILAGMDYGLAAVTNDIKVKRIQLSFDGEDLSNAVYSYFYRDKSGQLWTIINGHVYLLYAEKKELDLLDLHVKFKISAFHWIVEEPQGVYWLASSRGIVRYDADTEAASIHYTSNIGGSTLESPSPVAVLGGKIYFTGAKGLSVLSPHDFKSVRSSGTTSITELKVNSQTIQQSDENSIDLKYYENDIDLSLSNFHYLQQEECQYRYRLVPGDEEWVDLGSDNTIALYNMTPEDYVIELNSSNPDGTWSKMVNSLSINIKPAWWDTLLAKIILTLCLVGCLLAFQRYRYGLKLEQQRQAERLRNKISKDLHDDVGSVLTGIAMQSELLEDHVSEKLRPVAEKIADNSRQAVGRMRDTVWAIDSRRDGIADLIDRKMDFLDEIFPSDKKSYTFEKQISNPKLLLRPDIRQATYLIFKESMTNLVKHSDTDHVNISLITTDDFLELRIEDKGSEQKIKTSGQGLRNMASRAKEAGGSYNFYYENGYITIVNMPFN